MDYNQRAIDGFRPSSIPPGVSGDVSIEKIPMGPSVASLSYIRDGHRNCPVGEYTVLRIGGELVMSDTPAEMIDHQRALWNAKGSILINGLGIGMFLDAVLAKPEVTDVTVVEINQDVIKLVAPYFKDDRVSIVHASAFDYRPPKGKKYHMVWHDIWNDITSDNIDDMIRLHRKYSKRAFWQGSWCRQECYERSMVSSQRRKAWEIDC